MNDSLETKFAIYLKKKKLQGFGLVCVLMLEEKSLKR